MIKFEDLSVLNKKLPVDFTSIFSSFFDTGSYVLGSGVSEFESGLSSLFSRPVVGVASGLDALRLSIRIHNFPKDSEIIVASNSYLAGVLAVVSEGFLPVSVEPKFDTFNIDPSLIEERISSKTVAVLVTHLYGRSCELDEIMRICNEHGILLIEDCAQAFGARYRGKFVGTFGIGCLSFYPTKNLGAFGDGGAIICQTDEQADLFRFYRNYGTTRKYVSDYVGMNSRLDELQALLLNAKLPFIREINEHKVELATVYSKNISNPNIILPCHGSSGEHVFHQYVVRTAKRDELASFLLDRGIETNIHYPIPPHRQKAFANVIEGSFPVADLLSQTVLSLPISYIHSKDEINYISNVINQFGVGE